MASSVANTRDALRASMARRIVGEVVAIDGKTLRGCHDVARGEAGVSAWASETRMVLGDPHRGALQRAIMKGTDRPWVARRSRWWRRGRLPGR